MWDKQALGTVSCYTPHWNIRTRDVKMQLILFFFLNSNFDYIRI